ncbi:MAG: hypothetical protein KC776_10040, partial [Myxococcales bacterium]|nr:hypothetical protein [Myxococcales bacterium]
MLKKAKFPVVCRGKPRGFVMSSSKVISVELSATERTSLSALQDLSNRDLWSSAVVANAGRRKATAHLVAHLAEIERR